jgi:hypothetical protein
MDALRMEVAGLAEKLGEYVQKVDQLTISQARQEAAQMEQRLTAGSLTGSRGGGTATPDAIADGAPLMARLRDDANVGAYAGGRVDPLFGRSNLLDDPAMENIPATLLGAVLTDIGDYWEGLRAFTGAGTPTGIVQIWAPRNAVDSDTSSAAVGLRLGWAATTAAPVTGQIQFQPRLPLTAPTDAPWLVSSVRVRWDADDWTAVSATGTAQLVIVENAGGTTVAESDIVAFEDYEGETEVLLSCAVAAPVGDYYPRVIVTTAKPSVTGSYLVVPTITEFLLAGSDTEDPPTFTPAIAGWYPTRVELLGSGIDLESLATGTNEDLVTEFDLAGNGAMHWTAPDGTVLTSTDPSGAFGPFPIWITLDADTSTNSGTAQDLGLLAFECRSGFDYAFNIVLSYSMDNANQGPAFGWTQPGGGATARVVVVTNADGNGEVDHISGTAALSVNPGTVNAADTVYEANIFGHYRCTANGTFQFQFARNGVSGGTGVTVRKGSGGWVLQSVA